MSLEGGSSGGKSIDIWEQISELPPSAKLIAKLLEYDDSGELTRAQLGEKSLLPPQTVKTAVDNLEEIDAIESRYSVNDARKRVYCLNT